jgi:hypothetical protein
MCKLKQEVIEQIRGSKPLICEIGNAKGFVEPWTVKRWLNANDDNGPLVTFGVLCVIAKRLKVSFPEIVVITDPEFENFNLVLNHKN